MTFSKVLNPLIYVSLCLIWGSSFILMKWGLYDEHNQVVLTAWQVAAIRVLTAGVVLIPLIVTRIGKLPRSLWSWVVLSGILGVFAPAFLFCIAETHIDSSLAGVLNALTPFCAILFGFLLYKTPVPGRQILGIIIGLAGLILLFMAQGHVSFRYVGYAGYVLLATICYGINLNLVKHKLHGVPSLTIATVSFVALIIPAAIILYATGYFSLPLGNPVYIKSTIASCILGVIGSALSWIIFFILLKRTSPVFASSVTYITPVVALGWGWYYGEAITAAQVVCMLIILVGVYLTNPLIKKKEVRKKEENRPAVE
jgi:drug/metabolite transporter (DMT)-like permease